MCATECMGPPLKEKEAPKVLGQLLHVCDCGNGPGY